MTRSVLVILLLFGWLGAADLCGQGPAVGPAVAPAAGPAAAEGGAQGESAGHGHPGTMQMPNDAFFKGQFSHTVPYPQIVVPFTSDPALNEQLAIHNVNVFQWICLLLLVLIFVPVRNSFASGRPPGRITRVFRGWCHWIRDEMVYSVMGEEEGRKFAPYFMFVFFFVAAMNCIGLIPSVEGAYSIYTATTSPYVTGALAMVTFFTMLYFGMRRQGVFGFFKNLIPHGLPLALVPLMVLVELIGLFIKPFALMIRLFANMLAGHLVIASLVGLIFLFTKMLDGSSLGYLTALPAAGMAWFVYIIEAFVTLLQAYIFTYLSVIFLQLAMHPDH